MSNMSQELLDTARVFSDQGDDEQAKVYYHKAIAARPDWSTPHYNLGLIYKYALNWKLSYEHNRDAVTIDPELEAGWWNLGIAATALKDWRTARRAWREFGLKLDISDEEPSMQLGNSPVRLNPDDSGEVVWCKRVDPARAIILNIPFASSGHRYGDMVLNDGAPVGTRISEGVEYAVFNELQLLNHSEYSTYSVNVYVQSQDDINKLDELCLNAEVEMEDWSTIRWLCKQCSEGVPHEYHDQALEVNETTERYIGLASKSRVTLERVLKDWVAITLCEHSDLTLELE